jgi:hypothetical protein
MEGWRRTAICCYQCIWEALWYIAAFEWSLMECFTRVFIQGDKSPALACQFYFVGWLSVVFEYRMPLLHKRLHAFRPILK